MNPSSMIDSSFLSSSRRSSFGIFEKLSVSYSYSWSFSILESSLSILSKSSSNIRSSLDPPNMRSGSLLLSYGTTSIS